MKNNYSRFVIIALITLIVFLYALTLQARAAGLPAAFQQTVTGVVTDEAGIPLPGVSVIVKGTNRGTVTNLDGEYIIEAGPQAVLLFSYMGFERVEIPVEDRREIIVQLKEDINALEEVEINAGYYNTTRRESTGSISRVTAEGIEMQPVVSPLQALQGRMAGVEIVPGGSHPGMAPTIRIRGRNSLREEGNLPLYIVDGIPINSAPIESNSVIGGTGMDPLNFLNLSNIASIEVLKDADATAIYGSRGANGVVLITTKKGIYGTSGLEARVYTGVATVPNRLELLNTEQYLQVRRQAFENDGLEPTIYDAFDLILWDQDRYTDWQDFFFGGTSSITDVNLATSGGDKNTFFRLGGGYHTQGTVYPGDFDYRKVTGNVSVNHISENERLALDLSINYGVDNNELIGNISFADEAFTLPPNAPSVFLEDGSLNWEDWAAAGLNNPLEGFYNRSNTQTNSLVSGFGASYRLLKGLVLRSNFGYTYFSSREVVRSPKGSYNPSYWESIDHSSSHLETYRKSWIVEPQLVYNKEFEKVNLDALIGGTFQESEYYSQTLRGEGYVAEALIGNLGAAERILNAANQSTTYRYSAIFGRLGVDWDERYFLNITGRRDGSSRFGPGKKLANFWALGGAWIFHEEPLIKDGGSFLSFGKLRASYGTTGNDQIGDYGYLDAYEATPGPGGLYPTQLYNPNYSWEVNKKLEGAVELGFFEDRLRLAVSWYQNRSSNQLVGYPLPSITGFSTIQANLPATVENTGWEVELSSTNIQSKNFHWQTFFNLTIPNNELVSYPGIEQSSYANIYKVGYPLNISLLYSYEGLDPETGYYTIKDVNGDGRFDHEDQVITQDFGRTFFGGISNDLSYKNISLKFLVDFVKQKGTMDLFNVGDLSNQPVEVLEALGEGSRFQRISTSYEANDAFYHALYSNFPVVDASFLRFRNVALGYTFPSSVSKKMGLDDGKVFINGHNLYTLTNYKGMDPEVPLGGTSFAGLRTITGGLNIQF